MAHKIGRVKGSFCATSKKALRSFACGQKIKCRVVKVGKAIIAGKADGMIYCCKRSVRKVRRRRRRWR